MIIDVPSEQYHQRKLGQVSNTALGHLAISPAHYKAWVDGLRGTKETPALGFGRILHMAILEPSRFVAKYVVEPDFGDCRFKDNKRQRDEWRAEFCDAEHVSHDWVQQIEGMSASIMAHPMARRILEDGVAERTVRWKDPQTGLDCQARPDYYVQARALVADLKSCEDASPSGFARAVAKRCYHRQDALYREGMAESYEGIDYFLFVAVEKEPPYACAVYSLNQEAIGSGYRLVRSGIDLMHSCVTSGEWPAYAPGITELKLPAWAA